MASSSFLHLLLPFLILSMLLPCISCDASNDRVILQCERFIVNHEGSVTNEVKKALTFLGSSSSPGSRIHLKTISGQAWCRPDLPPTFCSSCLNMAAHRIQNNCAFNVVAARFLFDDFCYLRIDEKNFFGKLDTEFGRVWFNTAVEIAGVHKVAYWQTVMGLLMRARREMERGITMFVQMDSFFELGKMKISGMGLCSPDLHVGLCSRCVYQAMNVMKIRCVYQTYCEVIYGSCFLKYQTKPIKN